MNGGLIRPLDAYVAKYGKHLQPAQLVKIDGKVMAIAMMVNAQHLMYRKDIFDKLGIAEPKTYDDVLAAAAKIKASGEMATPVGATMRTGWNLAQDFVNMYMGFGGEFFGANNAPAINGPAGLKTLDMMKKLTAYMDPEYLNADSTAVQKQFQQARSPSRTSGPPAPARSTIPRNRPSSARSRWRRPPSPWLAESLRRPSGGTAR